MLFLKVARHLLFGSGLYHFFDSTSFKATLSSVKSATTRRSLAFSASSWRRAPYWAGLSFRNAHAAELGFPGVKRGRADARFTAHFSSCATALLLFEDTNDLLLTESTLLHKSAPYLADSLF